MKEIVFIAPYEQMWKKAQAIVRDPKYSSVAVLKGNLEEGLNLAINAVEAHARVLISRGGTYRLIKQANTGIPVVEIQSNLFDLIESLSIAVEQGRPLAIVGYSNVISHYDEKYLKKIIKTRLTIVNLRDTDDVKAVVEDLAARGYTLFLGDTITKKVCDEAGYDCYLQESGSFALQQAMDEALRLCMALKQEEELAQRLRAVIDFVHDGVIAADSGGRIILFNAIAQDMLLIKEKNILNTSIDTLSGLPFIKGMKEKDQIIDETFKIGERLLSVSTIPVSLGADSFGSVVIIRDVQELQAYERKLRVALADKGFIARHTFNSMVYASREMAHCISIAKKFSHYKAAVLIEGASGVGKELFAQSIHNYGSLRNGPFVAVNCAVLPKSLIESELFGYVEGAFTGSRKGGKAGYFEMAHKGTLFLDEISELPLDEQAHLLRVIQEKEVMRLGDTKIVPVDVRLICASNKNLVEMANATLFREDLLYRINTLSLYIPPLSNRLDDIEVLAAHFLAEFCGAHKKIINGFSPKALERLRSYRYRGNVRELRSMIERAVIICEGKMVRLSDLQSGLPDDETPPPAEAPAQVTLDTIEKAHIRRVLEGNNWSVSKAAAALGISRSTLWRKMNAFNI
ncbi:Fis family transcriptional regulator [Spirochaetia bacterium]|nr:Fis family transcriptional regulator [Spirochaetia bacterium]